MSLVVIWDDGLRDVEVRLHPVFDFDFNEFLMEGGWQRWQ